MLVLMLRYVIICCNLHKVDIETILNRHDVFLVSSGIKSCFPRFPPFNKYSSIFRRKVSSAPSVELGKNSSHVDLCALLFRHCTSTLPTMSCYVRVLLISPMTSFSYCLDWNGSELYLWQNNRFVLHSGHEHAWLGRSDSTRVTRCCVVLCTLYVLFQLRW